MLRNLLMYPVNIVPFNPISPVYTAVSESPYSVFKECFLTKDFLNQIAFENSLHATQRNCSNSIYDNCYRCRMLFWKLLSIVVKINASRDLLVSVCECWLVSDCLSVINFEKVRSELHYNDNEIMVLDKDVKYDRLHKLLSVLNHFNSSFKSIPFTRDLRIDKNICATRARTPFVS